MASCHEQLAVLIILSAVAAAGIRLASARFIVEKESITVISPASVRRRYDAAVGNFGVPDYGATLTGVVVYPEKGRTGCRASDGVRFKSKSMRPEAEFGCACPKGFHGDGHRCEAKNASKLGWFVPLFALACVVVAASLAAYLFYKYSSG